MLDTKMLIDALSSQNLVRMKKQTGNYMTCYCPFHNNGQERNPSCGILLEDQYRNGNHYPAGMFHCFSCGYANTVDKAIDDLMKIHDIKMSGVEWLIKYVSGYSEVDTSFDYLIDPEIMKVAQSKFAAGKIREMLQPKKYVSESELAKYRYTVPYMYERKLTDEIINMFDVGFDPDFDAGRGKTPSITFPVQDETGNTLFIYRRSIKGRFHNYPEDVSKPVYGLNMVPAGTQQLIVCESIINALTIWTYGLVAVALMGTGTPYQINQLKRSGIHNFILCMDGDAAGRRATDKLYKALSPTSFVWKIDMLDGEDVNSISRDQFFELYDNRY